MKAHTNTKTERQYYIDWLRILLILSVFLFHVGMIFNSWDWHVKNDVTANENSILRHIMVFLHYWRMPLLFLISGAGTYLAIKRRNSGQYIGERSKRLLLPFIIGVFTLVPIQVYIEKSAHYTSLFDFYPHMFEGTYPTGNFSWHHLWFIFYLFIISLFIAPLLKFIKSQRFSSFVNHISKIANFKLGLNIFVLPLILSQVLLRPYFPENTHAFYNDWAAIAFYIIFFLAGFIIISNKNISETLKQQRYWFLIETIIVTVLMFTVPFKMVDGKTGETLWHVLSIFLSWTCGITAIGFAKQHLNFNSNFRKHANEAIYPFYLLHQPIIVVIGSVVVAWPIAILAKVLIITILSFVLTIGIYWMLIRPFNLMRIIFGLKSLPKSKEHNFNDLKPVFISTKNN